jgi:hypothetical protein
MVFEVRVSYLLGRCSTTWATPLALFSFSYFSDMVFWVFTQGGPSDLDPPPYATSHRWDYFGGGGTWDTDKNTGTQYHAQLTGWDGVLLTFGILFCSIGIWSQSLVIARQAVYHLSHITSPGLTNFLPSLD